jgi:hypothetical protein
LAARRISIARANVNNVAVVDGGKAVYVSTSAPALPATNITFTNITGESAESRGGETRLRSQRSSTVGETWRGCEQRFQLFH